jgi:hypothetical protein
MGNIDNIQIRAMQKILMLSFKHTSGPQGYRVSVRIQQRFAVAGA